MLFYFPIMPKQNILNPPKIYKVFCVVGNKNEPTTWTAFSVKKKSIAEFIAFSPFNNWKEARKKGYKCIAFKLSQK